MTEKVIDERAGMPLIAAIVGYLLSKRMSDKN